MPLQRGQTDEVVGANIRRLTIEGNTAEYAVEQALLKARLPRDHAARWEGFAADCREEIGDQDPFHAEDNDDGTVNVRNVHIFTCNGDFDKSWWDQAIETHSQHESDGLVQPGVHIGHPLRDEKGAAKEERPNKGFLARLRRRGEQVYGDITSLARDVYEQIKKRELPGRSVELYKSLGRVGGMALLGSSMPKIPLTMHSADDMTAVYFANEWPPKKDNNMDEQKDKDEEQDPGQDETDGSQNEMDDETGDDVAEEGYDPQDEQRQVETIDRLAKVESALADLSEDVALVISATKEEETMPEKTKTDNKVEETAVDPKAYSAKVMDLYDRIQEFDVKNPREFAAKLADMDDETVETVIGNLKPKMPDPDLPKGLSAFDAAAVDTQDGTDRDKLAARVEEFAAKDGVNMSDPKAVEKLMRKLQAMPETKDLYQFAAEEAPAIGGSPADMEAPAVG